MFLWMFMLSNHFKFFNPQSSMWKKTWPSWWQWIHIPLPSIWSTIYPDNHALSSLDISSAANFWTLRMFLMIKEFSISHDKETEANTSRKNNSEDSVRISSLHRLDGWASEAYCCSQQLVVIFLSLPHASFLACCKSVGRDWKGKYNIQRERVIIFIKYTILCKVHYNTWLPIDMATNLVLIQSLMDAYGENLVTSWIVGWPLDNADVADNLTLTIVNISLQAISCSCRKW